MEEKYIPLAAYGTYAEALQDQHKLNSIGIKSIISPGMDHQEALDPRDLEDVRLNIKETEYRIALEIIKK